MNLDDMMVRYFETVNNQYLGGDTSACSPACICVRDRPEGGGGGAVMFSIAKAVQILTDKSACAKLDELAQYLYQKEHSLSMRRIHGDPESKTLFSPRNNCRPFRIHKAERAVFQP